MYEINSFSSVNLLYGNLIIRTAKDPRREERKRFIFPLYDVHK